MLEIFQTKMNTWEPPVMSDMEMDEYCSEHIRNVGTDMDELIIFTTQPYIDSLFISVKSTYPYEIICKRFVFHEDYCWSFADEQCFVDHVLKNDRLDYTNVFDEIFEYYSEIHPEWRLKRYYTNPMRLLDHIYHCMRKGTAQEILYKAELDELAAGISELDEMDLLSSKPSDIYDGISMRVLKSLNCSDGALLLADVERRTFVKMLQQKSPDMFKTRLNNAQCRYINFLIEGELTVDEVTRLFAARRRALEEMWAPSQYEMFIWNEIRTKSARNIMKTVSELDPIYKEFCDTMKDDEILENKNKIEALSYYLLVHREEYDDKIRRSNRKRNQDWQERKNGFVIRYPQTVNDFLRESIYMRNCLVAYVEAFVENDTTIILMRKDDDYNVPYITIEVYQNRLLQAFHRFNELCTPEEVEWIRAYCDRHGIDHSRFMVD